MAFPLWNRDRHVIKSFEIPEHWSKWRAIDWGFAAPWCCLWLARNPDTMRIYVYREVYHTELTDRQQARLILDMTPKSENVTLSYADPALWTRKNMEGKVSSTADEYAREGVQLTRADNDRIGGKRKVDRSMGDLADGDPGMQVFENCPNLIEQLSTLAHDELNVEDVDTRQEDHAYDTYRYGLTNERELVAEPTATKLKDRTRGLERYL